METPISVVNLFRLPYPSLSACFTIFSGTDTATLLEVIPGIPEGAKSQIKSYSYELKAKLVSVSRELNKVTDIVSEEPIKSFVKNPSNVDLQKRANEEIFKYLPIIARNYILVRSEVVDKVSLVYDKLSRDRKEALAVLELCSYSLYHMQVPSSEYEEKKCYDKMVSKVLSGYPPNEEYNSSYEIAELLTIIKKAHAETLASTNPAASSSAKSTIHHKKQEKLQTPVKPLTIPGVKTPAASKKDTGAKITKAGKSDSGELKSSDKKEIKNTNGSQRGSTTTDSGLKSLEEITKKKSDEPAVEEPASLTEEIFKDANDDNLSTASTEALKEATEDPKESEKDSDTVKPKETDDSNKSATKAGSDNSKDGSDGKDEKGGVDEKEGEPSETHNLRRLMSLYLDYMETHRGEITPGLSMQIYKCLDSFTDEDDNEDNMDMLKMEMEGMGLVYANDGITYDDGKVSVNRACKIYSLITPDIKLTEGCKYLLKIVLGLDTIDQGHLATVFNSLYGVSPKEYDVDEVASVMYKTFAETSEAEVIKSNTKVGKKAKPTSDVTKDAEKVISDIVKRKVNYEASMLIEIKVDAELDRLWNVPDFVKIEVAPDRIVLKNYPYSKDGLIQAIKENGGDVSSIRDIYFAGILIRLIQTKILSSAELSELPVSELERGSVKTEWLMVSESLAKVVMVVALHAYCNGIDGMNLKWYQSFIAVKGDFIQEQRLVALCRMIQANDGIGKVMAKLTVGDIQRENNVFTYRLTKLSSPGLVKKALQAMPFKEVLKYFDQAYIKKYMEFDKAGILAQVASGPLKPFCIGRVNPLAVTGIPLTMPLAQLAPIDEPPYDEPTLRRVKMILDAADIPYGKWYQGMKASQTITPMDMMFNSVVTQVAKLIKEKAKENVDVGLDLVSSLVSSMEGEGTSVVNALKMWK